MKDALLDLLYPRECVGCGAAISEARRLAFCAGCDGVLEWIVPPACPRCGAARTGERCGECEGREFRFAGATAVAYSTSGAQEAQQSGSRQNAFSLAEAGINNVMAVLNLPTNNALDPDTLPKCTNNEKKYTDPAADRTDPSTWKHSTIGGGTVR